MMEYGCSNHSTGRCPSFHHSIVPLAVNRVDCMYGERGFLMIVQVGGNVTTRAARREGRANT